MGMTRHDILRIRVCGGRYHPYQVAPAPPSFHVLAPTAPILPDESDSDDMDFNIDSDNSELDTDHESEVDDISDGEDHFIPRPTIFAATSHSANLQVLGPAAAILPSDDESDSDFSPDESGSEFDTEHESEVSDTEDERGDFVPRHTAPALADDDESDESDFAPSPSGSDSESGSDIEPDTDISDSEIDPRCRGMIIRVRSCPPAAAPERSRTTIKCTFSRTHPYAEPA